jgi:hypothetical protein
MDVLVEAGDGYTAKQACENHIPVDTPRADTAVRPYAECLYDHHARKPEEQMSKR